MKNSTTVTRLPALLARLETRAGETLGSHAYREVSRFIGRCGWPQEMWDMAGSIRWRRGTQYFHVTHNRSGGGRVIINRYDETDIRVEARRTYVEVAG